MKKINVRSPYYVTVDSFIAPPKVVPAPSGTYYYLNVFSEIYGVNVSSYTQAQFEALVCESCTYTWKLSDGNITQLIGEGVTKDDCGESTCNEHVQYTTYKAQRVPLEVGDSIYTNADTPAVATSLTGVVASNSINNPTSSTDVGEAVCFGSKKRIKRIYTVASGVVTSYVEPDNHCSTDSNPITSTESNVVCGQTINQGSFTGVRKYHLKSAKDTGDYTFTITGNNSPVKFTATWGTTSATTKYIGHSDFSDALLSQGITAGEMDLADPSSKLSKTLTLNKTAQDPMLVTLEAKADVQNDNYKIVFNCPVTPDNDDSDTSTLTFDSNTYINLWTGYDPVFAAGSGSSIGSTWTGTLETVRSGALKTSLLSFYADEADYNSKVSIQQVPWSDNIINYSTGAVDPIGSFNYPFLSQAGHRTSSGFKMVNIIFVSAAKGYYYSNEVLAHNCIQIGTGNPNTPGAYLGNRLHHLGRTYSSTPYGTLASYIVMLNENSGSYDVGEGRSSQSFQNLLKQISRGYITSSSEDNRGFEYQAPSESLDAFHKPSGKFYNTSYANLIKYDWSLDGAYRSISTSNLHTLLIGYLNNLGYRDGSGGNLT